MSKLYLLLVALIAAPIFAVFGERPNVILVVTDDIGYGDIAVHGNSVIKTPNLDRLHDESLRLVNFHATPMCTPTRGEIMTGMDAVKSGAMFVCRGRSMLRLELPTIAEVLQNNHYATGIFGKWHLGATAPHTPADRGFQETLWFRSSHIGGTADFHNNDYFDPFLIHNGVTKRFEGYITDILFDESMAWMKHQSQQGNSPFFAYLPLNAAHGPYWGEPSYRKKYSKLKEHEARFYGMVEQVDENMGRLLSFLEENDLVDNTIIVFTSDNGTAMGEEIFNAQMQGKKRSLYDGGHRVPCYIRLPETVDVKAQDVDVLTRTTDLFPTFLSMAEVKYDPASVDGVNLLPVLLHPEGEFDELTQRKSVMQMGDLHELHAGAVKWGGVTLSGNWRLVGQDQLFNVGNDPGQNSNVIKDYPEIATALRDFYEGWWNDLPEDHRDYIPNFIGVGFETAFLSAPDWQLGYCDHPGCHRGGLNVNGQWALQVLQAGRYKIEIARWPEEAKLPIIAGIPEFVGRDGRFEAGKAFPIASGKIEIAGQVEEKPVGKHVALLPFVVELEEGSTNLQGTFLDKNGDQLCGSYFAYVTYLGK